MTDWFTRTKRQVTHQWVVPTNEPWGACHNEVLQAIEQAHQHWLANPANQFRIRASAQDDRCVSIPDGAIRIKCEDDAIVIAYDEVDDA
jgi:hypothetical protein